MPLTEVLPVAHVVLEGALVVAVLVIYFKQRHLLVNYEKYMSIVDVDKLRQYDKYREEAMHDRMSVVLRTKAKSVFDEALKKMESEFPEIMRAHMDELEGLAWHAILVTREDRQEEFIRDQLPAMADHFLSNLGKARLDRALKERTEVGKDYDSDPSN